MVAKSWNSVVTGEELSRVAKNRSKTCIKISGIRFDQIPEMIEKGYEEVSRTSRTARMKLDKKDDELFEDEIWSCMYNVGFPYLSDGRNFNIPRNDDPDDEPKQIDVFAFDGNIALIIECKCATKKNTPGDFKKDLNEIRGDKEYITKEIRKHFGNEDIQVGFVFATKNYKIGDPVKRAAKIGNITLINEHDVAYYKELTKTLGNHARYQILSDIFKDCIIPSAEVKVPAIRSYNDGKAMYTFMISPDKLLPLAYVDRRVTNDSDEDFSYQRFIQGNKIKEIREYVQNGGFFANNIIINITTENEDDIFKPLDNNDVMCCGGILKLPPFYKSVWIIDGQHRLFGYTDTEAAKESTIPVTAFLNIDKEFQSKIFIDINNNQKRVDPSLLQIVLARSNMKSDKVTDWADALNTIVFQDLNEKEGSPLYQKIKENNTDKDRDLSIVSLRDVMKKTRLIGATSKSGTFYPGPLYMDREDKRKNTREKAEKFLENCFKIFRENCKEKWDAKGPESYLCTKNGLTSLIMTIAECIRIQYKGKEDRLTKESAESIVNQIRRYLKTLADYFNTISPEKLEEFKQQYGSGGQTNCFYKMMLIINDQYPQFTNEKIEKYKMDSDSIYATMINQQLPKLEELIIDHVKVALTSTYGDDWDYDSNFKEIGKELNNRRYDSRESDKPIEEFIDIETSYDIIRASDWNKFRPFFKVKNPEGGKTKEADIAWIRVIKDLHHRVETKQVLLKDDYELFKSINDVLLSNFTQTNNVKITENQAE